MTATLDAGEFQARVQRLDALVQGVERFIDPAVRAHVQEVVRAVLELHGAGLQRVLHHVEASGDAGKGVLHACAGDEVVAGLLLLHGLHPLDLETRVRQALDSVRPYLRSHGGDVELLGVTDGNVRLRLNGSCRSCPSSTVTMQQTIEEALLARAPDLLSLEVEGAAEGPPPTTGGEVRFALPVL